MDTGAMLAGYHSDMTRTVALGYVNDEQRAIYNTVLKAQLAVIDGGEQLGRHAGFVGLGAGLGGAGT